MVLEKGAVVPVTTGALVRKVGVLGALGIRV